MRHAPKLLALAVAATVLGAGGLDAQERARETDEGWWAPAVLSLVQGVTRDGDDDRDGYWWENRGRTDRDDRDDDDRYDRDDDDRYDRRDGRYEQRGRYESDRRGAKKGGPPFCRNGRGHPVHGWEWCEDKGYGGSYGSYGSYESRRDDRWERAPWEIILDRRPTRDSRMTQPTLGDVLGDVILGRLVGHGDRLGYRGDVDGRWMNVGDGAILQLRMGGMPLAELADRNRDGRIDDVLLSRGR